jgi:hypothetical protein
LPKLRFLYTFLGDVLFNHDGIKLTSDVVEGHTFIEIIYELIYYYLTVYQRLQVYFSFTVSRTTADAAKLGNRGRGNIEPRLNVSVLFAPAEEGLLGA